VVADNLENFRNDDLDLRIILTERARLNDRLPLPSSIEVLGKKILSYNHHVSIVLFFCIHSLFIKLNSVFSPNK